MDSLDVSPVPEFGDGVAQRAGPCTPRELFCALFVDPEEHVHFLQPAFRFVADALRSAEPPPLSADDPVEYVAACSSWARESLPQPQRQGAAARWPARVVREFAPAGLSDGAWLRGAMYANQIETEVGMWSLKQLMVRFGDPAGREPYALRYAALLRSSGIQPEAITRWEPDGHAPCADLSYEHALLGLSLGLFPSAFGLETLGFNLWMAELGPCPLLERLAPQLSASGACLRYLSAHDRPALAQLALQAVYQALIEADEPAALLRVARGFAAAHSSYLRWQDAMLGRNIPFEPREFLAELVRHKQQFDAVGEAERRALIETFPAEERASLVAAAHAPPRHGAARPLALRGTYTPPQDPAGLEQFAFARYSGLSYAELYHRFANPDRYPAAALFGKSFVEGVLAKLCAALDGDERLHSQTPPAYSERTLASLVAEQHEKNVRGRKASLENLSANEVEDGPAEYIGAIFDGCWLQGFADVRRADFEEYGWLFRIYASEHGDGDMAWNHSRIFRREFAPLGPDVMLPKTDERLYKLFDVGVGSVAKLAIALNTRRFMPEILGLNLGIEASGVGGTYLDRWKRAEGKGLIWEALAARLHNSIDNYADGHTKWSLLAVQAFMRRVKDAAPAEVPGQWHRIWRLWRLQDLLSHGSESERAALAEHLQLRSLAPT